MTNPHDTLEAIRNPIEDARMYAEQYPDGRDMFGAASMLAVIAQHDAALSTATAERDAAIAALRGVLGQYERAGWCECYEHSDRDPYPHTADCPVLAARSLLSDGTGR